MIGIEPVVDYSKGAIHDHVYKFEGNGKKW